MKALALALILLTPLAVADLAPTPTKRPQCPAGHEEIGRFEKPMKDGRVKGMLICRKLKGTMT